MAYGVWKGGGGARRRMVAWFGAYRKAKVLSVGEEFKRTKLKSLTAIRAFQYNLVLNHSMVGRSFVPPFSRDCIIHNIIQQRIQKLIYGTQPFPLSTPHRPPINLHPLQYRIVSSSCSTKPNPQAPLFPTLTLHILHGYYSTLCE